MIVFRTTLLLVVLSSSCFGRKNTAHVKFQWNYVNFTWPSPEVYQKALDDGSYIPENNIVTGIKIWKDRMYLTTPRQKNGVPATLVSTSLKPINGNISPLLEPFPNWEMQKLDDCSAFQYVQSMEIDVMGRMWILENGRTEFFSSSPRTKCSPRLVIIDLERENQVLLDYKFSDNVVNKSSVFLDDIVLDHEGGGYAYITDSDSKFPGIIVFTLRSRNSWKITHESMKADKRASKLTVNGTVLKIDGTVNGIALSPPVFQGIRTLYYAPLASVQLYSVPVNQLKRFKLQNVTVVARKTSQTGGMVMSSAGRFYYGLMTKDSVAVWDSNRPFKEHVLFHDQVVNQWPDTFAISTNSRIYWTTNRSQKFLKSQLNLNDTNFRVITSKIRDKSYQYYRSKKAPVFSFY